MMTTIPSHSRGAPRRLGATGRSREQRDDRRYDLARPLEGVLEHAFERYEGQVLNVSRQGFLLQVPGLAADQLASDGITDFGEVMVGRRHFGGFGRIVHVEDGADGVRIGFHWDPYVLTRPDALIDELLHQVVASGAA